MEKVGRLEGIRVTMIQCRNESEETALWMLRFKDINFISTFSVLAKTVKVTALIVCFFEDDFHL